MGVNGHPPLALWERVEESIETLPSPFGRGVEESIETLPSPFGRGF
jgi:hypothetical protein